MAADRSLEPLDLLARCADAVAEVLAANSDWGPSGRRAGQYAVDLTTDEAALSVLREAGVSILSEESGFESGRRPEVVVLDPLDGSTNASRGIAWYATSMCVVDASGPAAAMVVNQATGVRYTAIRGSGAWRDGSPIRISGCVEVADAIVAVSGAPPPSPGWAQFRAFGAAALDLCLVADGTVDGFVDCIHDAHGVWDYLAGALICLEAGGVVSDAHDRDLVVLEHAARRTPVAAATAELRDVLMGVRRTI